VLTEPYSAFYCTASRTRIWQRSGWDLRVSGLPESKEILIGDAGLGGVALQGECARNAEMCQRADMPALHHTGPVEDLLKLGGGFAALMQGQEGLATNLDGIQIE
jgi:hypothetical protein